MNQEIDDDLIDRVMRAMRKASAANGSDSPHTHLEAMARAAIEMLGRDDEER